MRTAIWTISLSIKSLDLVDSDCSNQMVRSNGLSRYPQDWIMSPGWESAVLPGLVLAMVSLWRLRFGIESPFFLTQWAIRLSRHQLESDRPWLLESTLPETRETTWSSAQSGTSRTSKRI